MNILETIKERRSTLAFKKQEVDFTLLKEIFTYASYAPSHYMTEAWQVKLFQGEGEKHLVNAILESYYRSGMLSRNNKGSSDAIGGFLMNIPHHALIYFEKREEAIRNEEEYASISAFIQNAQLAAWEMQVGMLWTITPYMHDELFTKQIGLDPEKHKIAAVLQIGYPEKVTRKKKRKPAEDFIEIVDA